MEIKTLLAHCDHTLLRVSAAWEEIRAVCDEGIRFGTASVCIPACYVRQAAEYARGRVKICTVIGFPSGYSTAAAKAFEAADAVKNGADEVDMVLNVGFLKSGRDEEVLSEIRGVRAACVGRVLKVIIETCLLTEEEKIRACRIVSASGADYIKTSTGFSTGGATREDVALLAAHVTGGVKVKAAGGIASLQDAADFLAAGADRLGTSRLVKLAEAAAEKENSNG